MPAVTHTLTSAFAPGAYVEAEGVEGTVTVCIDVGRDRQVVGFRTADGTLRAVIVDLGDAARLLVLPVGRDLAESVARQIVAGLDPRIPVATQTNVLAAWLLVAGGGG